MQQTYKSTIETVPLKRSALHFKRVTKNKQTKKLEYATRMQRKRN